MELPDVSNITPLDLDISGGRSQDVIVVFINDYGRYQRTVGYWHDIDKTFKTHSGIPITNEIVRTE